MHAMKRMNNDMAVSPIVATLVLIVVAVIGAVAVGTIMGTFSTQVSKQASASQAGSASQQQVLIAGSTTLYPAELNLQTDYARINPGIQLNIQGGGSGAGVSSVAMGIADIGAASNIAAITNAQSANSNDQNYQNLYYTMIGARGVVFITNKDNPGVTATGSDYNVSYSDLAMAYNTSNISSTTHATNDAYGKIIEGAIMECRESGSGTQETVSAYLFGDSKTLPAANAVSNNGNAAMLASVQSTKYAVGFVDSGYAYSGDVSSTTVATGIRVLNITDSNGNTYVPSHANIKNALKDWYYQKTQDNTGKAAGNYPQGLVGPLYWITKGTSPTASSTTGIITTQGTSAASSVVTNLINFAKSPSEKSAFNNAGMYALYDFA